MLRLPASATDLYALTTIMVILMPIPLALLVTWDDLNGTFRRILLVVAGANILSLATLTVLAGVL